MSKKYNICITLNGEPFMPYNKPLSKRSLPMVNGEICFYVLATVFDAAHGTILGTGIHPTRTYRDRKDFLMVAPWRDALRHATKAARGKLIFMASKQLQALQRTAVDRRKKHTRDYLGGES